MEIWKNISNYIGLYQVSNLGRIKSLARYHGGSPRKEKILKPRIGNWGYHSVLLQNNKNKKGYLIHRLVASTFILNPENKPQVNHINGLKYDNRVENLEWVTPSENIIHSIKNGLQKIEKGDNAKNVKLFNADILYIKNLYATGNYTYRQISNMYGMNENHIGQIIREKIRTKTMAA